MSPEFRLSARQVLAAHAEHQAGWSLRAISRMYWREWGYASADSACDTLRRAMKVLELPVRDQRDATVDALLRHGHLRVAHRAADHPNHAEYLAHIRHARALKHDT